MFLDISKVFDKVWHDGLIFKLQNYDIDGKLDLLNVQTSSWKNIFTGVPYGFILEPLLFLIYINDLPNGLISYCKIFEKKLKLKLIKI